RSPRLEAGTTSGMESRRRLPSTCALPSVAIARQAFGLGDALVLGGGLEDGPLAQLADDATLDFLPGRLVLRIFIAASRLQRRAPFRDFRLGDQDIGLTLVEVDPHPVAGTQYGEIAASRRLGRGIED